MAKFLIKFEKVNFEEISGIYGATVAGELSEFDIATDSDMDFENAVIKYESGDLESITFIDIFNEMCMALVSENADGEFKMSGSYEEDDKVDVYCEYNAGQLMLKQVSSDEAKEIAFTMENGLFNDDDADEFACFFEF